MEISLCDVTIDNWLDVIHLDISKEQESYVALNVESIAKSRFYPHYKNRAIYRDNEAVGFLQYYQELDEGLPDEFYIAQFMVDLKHQGQGIGKIATQLAIQEISSIPDCKIISVHYVPGYHLMRNFYSQYGFVVTEESDEDGVVMELRVKD